MDNIEYRKIGIVVCSMSMLYENLCQSMSHISDITPPFSPPPLLLFCVLSFQEKFDPETIIKTRI